MHMFDGNVKGAGGQGWKVGVGGGGLHFGIHNKEVFRRKFNWITIDGLNFQPVIDYLLD